MDLRMSKERLQRRIREQAELRFEARQVFRRLKQLLPTRLKALKYALAKTHRKMALSERYALVSSEYLSYIDELTEVLHQAQAARVQYETHLMLIQARQTLNRLKG